MLYNRYTNQKRIFFTFFASLTAFIGNFDTCLSAFTPSIATFIKHHDFPSTSEILCAFFLFFFVFRTWNSADMWALITWKQTVILNTVQRLTVLCVISVTCLLSRNKGERQSLSPFFFLLLVFWDGHRNICDNNCLAWHKEDSATPTGRPSLFLVVGETLELGEAFSSVF